MTHYHGRRAKRSSAHRLGRIVLALFLLGVLAFGGLLGTVLAGSRDSISGQPRIMLILGCQVRSNGPSVLLKDRLDEALDYYEDHRDLTIVVSGGQGRDEAMSEARCMYDYLVEHGVPKQKILQEDQSFSTLENLKNTMQLLQQAGYGEQLDQILIVSNGFHLTRVRMLFDRVWVEDAQLSTLAAPTSHAPSRLKMYVREPLALVKSFVLDH